MRTLALLFLLLLAACGSTPPRPEYAPEQPQNDAQTRARIHTELAANYFARRQLNVALEEVSAALQADSGYGPAYNVLGLVYMEMREDAVAEQHFKKALEINPVDPDARNNYGSFLCSRGRYDEAIEQYMATLKNPLYRTPEQSYLNAGLCLQRKGDDAGAAFMYQKALTLAPLHPAGLVRMAELHYRQRELADARKLLGRYMQVAKTPAAEALWLGVRLERKLGDRPAEESYAAQLRKRYPGSEEVKALDEQRYD